MPGGPFVDVPAGGTSHHSPRPAANPMDTVANGIAKAVALGYPQVDVAQGTYSEGTTGVALVTNINIAGGWSQDFSTETGANTTTVIQGGQASKPKSPKDTWLN